MFGSISWKSVSSPDQLNNVNCFITQRNQIPGPMSPRFTGMQHQQHPSLSQLIRPGPSTPNSQMSPHFNQQQNQWNMRQQQAQQPAMQSPISNSVPKVRVTGSNMKTLAYSSNTLGKWDGHTRHIKLLTFKGQDGLSKIKLFKLKIVGGKFKNRSNLKW